jgi:hypothetical protein
MVDEIYGVSQGVSFPAATWIPRVESSTQISKKSFRLSHAIPLPALYTRKIYKDIKCYKDAYLITAAKRQKVFATAPSRGEHYIFSSLSLSLSLSLSGNDYVNTSISILKQNVRSKPRSVFRCKSAFFSQFIRIVALSRRGVFHVILAKHISIPSRRESSAFPHFYADRCKILHEIARMCSRRAGGEKLFAVSLLQ